MGYRNLCSCIRLHPDRPGIFPREPGEGQFLGETAGGSSVRQRSGVITGALALVCFGSLFARALPAGSAPPAKLFGAYAATRGSETKVQAFQDLEKETGRSFSMVRLFYSWNSSYPDSAAKWAASNSKTPVISVKTHLTNGSAVSWSSIA